MSGNTIILVADDHPLFRDALASAIQALPERCTIRFAATFDEAMRALDDEEAPELVLLDLNMPGSRGLSGLSMMRSQFPAIAVIIVSAVEDAGTIRRSIAMGASGYVPKSSTIEEMRAAVSRVLAGEVYTPEGLEIAAETEAEEAELIKRMQSLTPQQSRVLAMLGEGLLNKQIAYELDVSEATIKAHVSAILTKLNVDSRTQAVITLAKLNGPGEASLHNS